MIFYEKILSAFNSNDVEYLIVGGMAVNLHGVDRTTKDLDIWMNNSEINLSKLHKAFAILNFDKTSIVEAIERISKGETIIIPDEKNLLRIDLMGLYSSHLGFVQAYQEKIIFQLGTISSPVISLLHLIDTKITAGREKDLMDARNLQRLSIKSK